MRYLTIPQLDYTGDDIYNTGRLIMMSARLEPRDKAVAILYDVARQCFEQASSKGVDCKPDIQKCRDELKRLDV